MTNPRKTGLHDWHPDFFGNWYCARCGKRARQRYQERFPGDGCRGGGSAPAETSDGRTEAVSASDGGNGED